MNHVARALFDLSPTVLQAVIRSFTLSRDHDLAREHRIASIYQAILLEATDIRDRRARLDATMIDPALAGKVTFTPIDFSDETA